MAVPTGGVIFDAFELSPVAAVVEEAGTIEVVGKVFWREFIRAA